MSHAFRNVRGVDPRWTDERLAGGDRHEGRRVWAALGHHLRSQRERRGELDLPQTLGAPEAAWGGTGIADRKSTRLNSSHITISYAVFCLKKKKDRGVTIRMRRRER